jgi:hypothetical protein
LFLTAADSKEGREGIATAAAAGAAVCAGFALQGQTMRAVGGHVLVCNPLPGVGALSALTHLVARSNYGINRSVRTSHNGQNGQNGQDVC